MSDARHTRHTPECGADVAAYALGALEAHEVEQFRRHVESCVVCREELASLQNVVAALAMAAPQYPAPPGLKRRVMSGVREDVRLQARGRRPARSWNLGMPRAALAGGLALVVAAVTLGGVELSGGGSSTRVIQASVFGVPGSAQLRVSGSHGELVVQHLPPPPAGRIYEVWVKHGSAPPSPTSALFSVTADGSATVDVPGNLQGVKVMMVTQEPAGGSRVPTQPPVIVAQLT